MVKKSSVEMQKKTHGGTISRTGGGGKSEGHLGGRWHIKDSRFEKE